MKEILQRRRDHNRLGFAYQMAFVRLVNRFPAQQPLEVLPELNETMHQTSICGLGQVALAPILSMLRHFPDHVPTE